jgi:hypothetical protein
MVWDARGTSLVGKDESKRWRKALMMRGPMLQYFIRSLDRVTGV